MYEYTDLPDDARVWVYQISRKLSPEEIKIVKSKSENFISSWSAHGDQLRAAIEVFYNLFLVVFIDEAHAQATGCSIDKSFQFIKQLEDDIGITLLDRMVVAHRQGDDILLSRIDEFEQLIKDGHVNNNTIVFNNLVDTKRAFDSKWEVLLKDSWQRKLIK